MGKEFRVECKFCLKPIMAPIELCGKKVKCPSCKNPVLIPRVKSADEEVQVQVKQKNENNKKEKQRAIQSRHKKGRLGQIIKYCIVIIVLYFGYKIYVDLNSKNNQTVEDLLIEYQKKEDTTTGFFIKNKVEPVDLETVLSYSKAEEEHVRAIVAECLAKMQYSEDIYNLLKDYLENDTNNVKIAAARSCGQIEQIDIVSLLIDCLGVEEDKGVKGSIGGALRELTGVRGNTVNHQRWKMWWQERKRNYQFPKIK